MLIAENNIKKSSNYYNKFFKYDWDFYTLPFVYHKKFKNLIKFKNRKDKAYAFGSITHEINDSHFIKFFKTSNLQPSRNLIFNNKEKLKNQIDSYINNGLREKNWDKDLPKRSFFRFLFSDFYKIIRLLIEFTRKVPKINNELNYFKNDIVAQINEYKMFVCPHEICDLPGIGFVEGMACGAAFIAEENSMYNNLGMIDGVHYINYDGSIKDLIIKIKYYQKHSDELEQIAENGYNFVIQN